MSVAEEIIRIKENIANAYTEAQSKGATMPQNQNSANLASTIETIQGGGSDIHGVIEQYKANENITIGDFVSFINQAGDLGLGNSENLSSDTSSGTSMSAVQIDNSRVFIAHSYGSNYYLYGMICSIQGSRITVESDTPIVSSNYAGRYISAVKIDNNKVFISHSYSTSLNLYGVVCIINNDNTIVFGTDTVIKLDGNSIINGTCTTQPIAVCLNSNTVFLKYGYHVTGATYGYYAYLYGVVCVVDGTTITQGSAQRISNEVYSGEYVSITALSEDKVFIAHSREGNYSLYGIICTISGTSITKGTDTMIGADLALTQKDMAIMKISSNKVFIVFSNNSNLCGIVCTVTGNTISSGTVKVLSNNGNALNNISIVPKNDTEYFVISSNSIILCSINNSTITIEETLNTEISNSSPVKMSNKIFMANGSSNLKGTFLLYEGETLIKKVGSNTDVICGIANSAGEEGDMINVYIPDYEGGGN